jgi:hypothetical protein
MISTSIIQLITEIEGLELTGDPKKDRKLLLALANNSRKLKLLNKEQTLQERKYTRNPSLERAFDKAKALEMRSSQMKYLHAQTGI